MFHNFKLYDEETLLFNSCFVDDEDIEYAHKHRFNVLYTETRYTDTFSLINRFTKMGYKMEIVEEQHKAPDGIALEPKLYAKFVLTDTEEKPR